MEAMGPGISRVPPPYMGRGTTCHSTTCRDERVRGALRMTPTRDFGLLRTRHSTAWTRPASFCESKRSGVCESKRSRVCESKRSRGWSSYFKLIRSERPAPGTSDNKTVRSKKHAGPARIDAAPPTQFQRRFFLFFFLVPFFRFGTARGCLPQGA